MPRRLGLYGPFIALAIAAGAGSLGWLWLKADTLRRMDALAARTAASGGAFSWSQREVGGFPFHLEIGFKGLSWRDPSGWAVSAPSLKAEELVFVPGHWVAFAPDGAVIGRPSEGPVQLTAKVLRASLFDTAAHPPSFSLEAIGVTFTPAPGAAPHFLNSAGEVHLHTRAGPHDEGAFYAEFDQAVPSAGGVLGAMADGKPVTLTADAIYGHAGALTGPSWAAGVRAWVAAGGRINLRRLRLGAGATTLFDAHGDGMTVGDDGRLDGALSANIPHAQGALNSLAVAGVIAPDAARSAAVALGARGAGAPVDLDFQAGRTTLGPVALFPAPKVY